MLRRLLTLVVVVVIVIAVNSMLLPGCDGIGSGAPNTLLNGSRAAELSVDPEGVESPRVLTSVAMSNIGEIRPGSASALCLTRAGSNRVSRPIVVRVGVSGESVTFRDGSQHGLYGCDNSRGLREAGQQMCGVAFGQLSEGRLRDPRLDIGACTTEDEASLGFAWIEPSPRSRYIAVEQDGYVEVYETAARLPVRVTTSDVEIEQSSATFRVSEHSSDGKLIRKYRLEPSVAG